MVAKGGFSRPGILVTTDRSLRSVILSMVYEAGEGHIPSSFSIVDILDFLYGNFLRLDGIRENHLDRDIFILSKGHGAAALYAVLSKYNIISHELLRGYSRVGGVLGGHPDRTKVPGVEASTGSLGHGLPIAVGAAIASRIRNYSNRTVVLLGDGECQEGTNWEAAHVAANQGLHNLIAIVDWNKSGQQLTPLDDIPAKWKAFGWAVVEADGHDSVEIESAFSAATLQATETGLPAVIIAHTVKGKGLREIEGHGVWHHRIPTEVEYSRLMAELG